MNRVGTIGRSDELERLRAALRNRETRLVVVTGEGGVGKSHLLEVVANEVGAVRAFGTAAIAQVPLGAMTHLVRTTSLTLTEMVADVVSAVPVGGVLAIDDIDQCDEVSLGVALRVARDHARTLIATVRTVDGVLPQAVAEFAYDAGSEVVRLGPFGRAETEAFVESLLGDVVDAGVVAEVWQRTGGNALFIAQIVKEARECQTLTRSVSGWVAHGQLAVPARLRQLLVARIGGLDPAAREGACFLAAVGSIGIREVEESARRGPLERLVDAGVAAWDRDVLRFVHPLFAEVLWEELSPLRRREVLREHLRLARRSPSPDTVRLAVLALDAGESPDAEGLLTAARLANAGGSAATAQRLAQAAVAAGTGDVAAHAALVLAASLSEVGRSADAVATLRLTAARTEPGPLAVALAVTMHKLIVWGTFDLAAASDALRAEARRYPPQALIVREAFAIAEADSRIYAGQAHRAEELLSSIDITTLPRALTSLYATTTAHVLTHLGSTGAALTLLDTALADALAHPAEVIPGTRDRLLVIASHAAREHGDFQRAVEYAERSHDGALSDGLVVGRAWGAVVASAAWGQRGDLDAAALWARRGLVAAAACGMVDAERLALAMLMVCAASRGQVVEERVLQRLAELPAGVGFLFLQMPIAHAWAQYGAGRRGEAQRLLAEGADAAREADAKLTEAWILHEQLRMGELRGVASRLRALGLDSPLMRARLTLADGLEAGDPVLVMTASELFEGLDAQLFAAEAAAASSRLTAGRPAAAAARRARLLASKVGSPTTPLLAGLGADPLSPRERTVVERAAAGDSNAAIAEALGLSVRTVENHLARSYPKLGVGSRSELAEILIHPRTLN